MTTRFILGPRKATLVKALAGAETLADGYDVFAFQVVKDVEYSIDTTTGLALRSRASHQVVMMYRVRSTIPGYDTGVSEDNG